MEPIILHSVRCALPFFLVAFVASSLATLWPSRGTRWLLANRRYFGLAFAFAMAWHFTFVAYSTFSFGNTLGRTALLLDLLGAFSLLILTVTSFIWIARRMSVANWRRVHKLGVYVIWLLATDIYLGVARRDRDALHLAILGVLLLAWGLRLAAWTKENIALRFANE